MSNVVVSRRPGHVLREVERTRRGRKQDAGPVSERASPVGGPTRLLYIAGARQIARKRRLDRRGRNAAGRSNLTRLRVSATDVGASAAGACPSGSRHDRNPLPDRCRHRLRIASVHFRDARRAVGSDGPSGLARSGSWGAERYARLAKVGRSSRGRVRSRGGCDRVPFQVRRNCHDRTPAISPDGFTESSNSNRLRGCSAPRAARWAAAFRQALPPVCAFRDGR